MMVNINTKKELLVPRRVSVVDNKKKKAYELLHRWKVLKYVIDKINKMLEHPELLSSHEIKVYEKRIEQLENQFETLKMETNKLIKELREFDE